MLKMFKYQVELIRSGASPSQIQCLSDKEKM